MRPPYSSPLWLAYFALNLGLLVLAAVGMKGCGDGDWTWDAQPSYGRVQQR